VPEYQPDVPLLEVLLYGILNPAMIVVAFIMGQRADAPSKLLIASFTGAIAGIAVLNVLAVLKLWDAPTVGRSGAGVFIVSLIAGLVYAGLGYLTKRGKA